MLCIFVRARLEDIKTAMSRHRMSMEAIGRCMVDIEWDIAEVTRTVNLIQAENSLLLQKCGHDGGNAYGSGSGGKSSGSGSKSKGEDA